MCERSRASVRGLALLFVALLSSCATAISAPLPDSELGAGAGGNPAAAGNPAAGSSPGGKTGAGGASSVAGSGTTAGSSAAGAGGKASSGGGGAGGRVAGGGASGAAGAGMLLFSEDFEDGTVDDWVPSGGMWAVASDGTKVYAQQATGTGSMILLSSNGSPTWTDQRVEARIKVLAFGGQSASYFAAIYARYSSAGYYALALRYDGKIVIRKGNSNLGATVAAGITAGTWYTVRLDVIGSTLNAYVDGVLKASETDSSITAGGIAVSAVNATAEFDDIKVNLP